MNENFYKKLGPHTLSKIIEFLKDEITCFPTTRYYDQLIENIKPLQEASSNDISFLSNRKYTQYLKTTKAAACIVPEDFDAIGNDEIVLLRTRNSYFAYAKLINLFYSKQKTYRPKIMESAYIANSAIIGNNCYIGHNVVIEENVQIGDDCVIEAGSFIDSGVVIGNRALIYPQVTLSYAIVGDDAVIFPGAKIGQDGFGFATEKGVHHKIFHTGIVKIGNDVEIGTNTTIDRGSVTDTVIEDFCRIDNLVQIGHSVKIGKGSIIVAQVGIAGSSVIGKYCALGGQVGVAGHITIGDNTQVAGQGGVIQDVKSGLIVGGTPTVPIRDWHRQSIIMKRLIKGG